ncbi:MAG: chemotaxis protein CheV [Pseudomonadales bacterium]|nr:chemotaxis protein CheV [Pseudomonadales bacterium]
MAGVLETVNQRTQLVGKNRLELLLFRLGTKQTFGINVFKVKEVLQCPALTQLPKSDPVVSGVANIRGQTISIVDLAFAVGSAAIPEEERRDCFVIITEYNRLTQGFLVRSVERIVNMNWESIHPPPRGVGDENYLTAVTEIEGRLVEIIDVEKVLSEVVDLDCEVSEEFVPEAPPEGEEPEKGRRVIIADDSLVARKQLIRCLETIGLEVVSFNDGRQTWDFLLEQVEAGIHLNDEYLMLISDIEMPEMDGYTLTSNIRGHSELSDMHVVLHTSLSGVFNQSMVEKVGANNFIAKFQPDELAKTVFNQIEVVEGIQGGEG